ncbi:hypothetical protein [Clostridium psychrophilum]|nr:hypothetical protein [Clostridium psychrophilum]
MIGFMIIAIVLISTYILLVSLIKVAGKSIPTMPNISSYEDKAV